MKNLSFVASALALAVSATSAYAQVFSYADQNVLFAIRQDSSPTKDLIFNLGPITQFQAGGAYSGLTEHNLTAGATDIGGIFRATYGGSVPSGLDVGIYATKFNGLASTGKGNLWLSRTRVGAVGPAAGSEAVLAGSGQATQGLYSGTVARIGNNGVNAANTGPLATAPGFVAIAASDTYSFTNVRNDQNNWNLPTGQGGFQESLTTSGTPLVMDFFFTKANTAASYLGYFTLKPNGALSFTPIGATVPEPQEYAAICGLGLAAFALWRRSSSK